MRQIALIHVLLFAFVALACDSYRGAVAERKMPCHPVESKGVPQEMSFDCCNGVPAKSKVDLDQGIVLVDAVRYALINIPPTFAPAFQAFPFDFVLKRYTVLRL